MKWEWKGHKLAHPLTILRRLVFCPFIYAARALLFVAMLLGWSLYDAQETWRRLE